MSQQVWTSVVNAYGTSGTTTGTALANSTTLTDISPGANAAGQALTIPANTLQPGQLWRFTANGIYSTTGTPTLLLGVYWGGVAGVALAASAATTTATGVSNGVWRLVAESRVTATGTSGTILTLGMVNGIAATSANPVLMPATSSTGGSATIDTSTAKVLTVGAAWGTANASNTVTCYTWIAELLS